MKHITKKVNRYYLHWNVPRDLRHLFNDRVAVTRTLQTSDLGLALLRRDQAVAELEKVVRNARGAQEHQQFISFVDEIRKLGSGQVESVTPITPTIPTASTQLAQHATLVGNSWVDTLKTDLPEGTAKQGIQFKEAVKLYLKEANGTLAVGAVSRLKVAPPLFLQHIDRRDIHLADIDQRDVLSWVAKCSTEKAAGTVKAYLISMSNVWDWAYRNRKVNGDNPFRDLNLRLPPSANKRGAFTVEQVTALLESASPGLRVLMEFALVTGCRMGELTPLTGQDFHEQDGVHYFTIQQGKTANAARAIPLPFSMWERLKAVVDSGLWARPTTPTRKVAAQYWSAMFQKLKGAVLGDVDGLVFHSFRKMAATGYQRAGVFEGTTAALLGHSRRGLTMSYGLYSTGLELRQLLEAVETMLASPYMQQYLVLFNK